LIFHLNCERHSASRDCFAIGGSDREVRDLLKPVYTWFTEGLDSRDLVDAKELLDQLE
jgi:hypothetical protein